MNNFILAAAAVAAFRSAAHAERFVTITHTLGTDPFWSAVQRGGEAAAKAVGAEVDYNFAASGDMANLIVAAAATQPDGIVVSMASRTPSTAPTRARSRAASRPSPSTPASSPRPRSAR